MVHVFGSLVSDYLVESKNSMTSLQTASGVLAENVNKRLKALDARVDDQVQWLGAAANKTAAGRSGLDDALSLRDAFKQNIMSLDEQVKLMNVDMRKSLSALNNTITDNLRTFDLDTSDFLKKVYSWRFEQNAASSKTALGSM